jgi:hypothetical protein
MAAMSAASLVVCVPTFVPPGCSLRWHVGVGDRWVAPGAQLIVEAGATEIAVRVEMAAPAMWLDATALFLVDVMPAGVTRVVIPTSAISRLFAPRSHHQA